MAYISRTRPLIKFSFSMWHLTPFQRNTFVQSWKISNALCSSSVTYFDFFLYLIFLKYRSDRKILITFAGLLTPIIYNFLSKLPIWVVTLLIDKPWFSNFSLNDEIFKFKWTEFQFISIPSLMSSKPLKLQNGKSVPKKETYAANSINNLLRTSSKWVAPLLPVTISKSPLKL